MFLIGALDNISVVVRHTLIQLLTPDEMRGRMTAVGNVFIVASNELGGVESGLAAYCFGLVPSIVGGGVGAILVVLGPPPSGRRSSRSARSPACDRPTWRKSARRATKKSPRGIEAGPFLDGSYNCRCWGRFRPRAELDTGRRA